MLKDASAEWLIVLIWFLIGPCVSAATAGEVRYYDQHGNQISETEYRRLQGTKTTSPQNPKKPPSPVKQEKISSVEKDTKSANDTDDQSNQEAIASTYNVVSETIIRVFERDAAPGENIKVIPVYEYLSADYGSGRIEGLSLHFQGWGRTDLGDGGFYEDDTDGEVLHGYLQYAHPGYGFNLKVGRQYIFKGVANESLDGVGFETVLTPFFDISAYGGLPVGLDKVKGRSGDRIWGGRIAHHMGTRYEIGVSYKMTDNDDDTVEEMTSIDVFVALTDSLSLNGFSARNLDTDDWAEHAYEAFINLQYLDFRFFYERYRYEDFFIDDETSSKIFGFLKDTNEVLSVIGSDVFWRLFKNVDLGATVKHFDYDLRKNDALFYSGHLAGYITPRIQIGGEIGSMDGDTPETRYLLTRAYFYWDKPQNVLKRGFVTGDVVYIAYDEEIFGKDQSLFLSLGAGMDVVNDTLKVKISGDYSNDPFFDKDVRGMLAVILVF